MTRRFPIVVVAAAVVAAVLAAIVSGCAPKPREHLPPYTWVDEQTALNDLRERTAGVTTVSAPCSITLTRADGQSVQLDGVLVMQRPNRIRMRAWKFDRAVFDLTLNDHGLWMMTSGDARQRERVLPASTRAADFVRELSLFTGGFFTNDPPPKAEIRGRSLLLTRDSLHCEVDRETLTPRRFYVRDHTGQRFELKLSGYRLANGIPWATRLEAVSEMGRVVVEQREVEINGELAPGAFVPPTRAEKRQ